MIEFNHTPLYYAAKHGHPKTAEALIAAGADKRAIVEKNYGKPTQLTQNLKEGEAYLWCLGFEGYAVKTREHLLIFNPLEIDESSESGLANGNNNPAELTGQKITVHISQGFVSIVPKLPEVLPEAEFIVYSKPTQNDSDTSEIPPYLLARPNESFSRDGIQAHTIQAIKQAFLSGKGLGYLVEADGVKIFYAGLHASSNDSLQIVN